MHLQSTSLRTENDADALKDVGVLTRYKISLIYIYMLGICCYELMFKIKELQWQ